VKRVQQLKHAPLRIFPQFDPAAERLPRRIHHDQFNFAALAQRINSRRHFRQHPLVQQIVLRTVQRQPRHLALRAKFHKLKILHLRSADCRHRPQHFRPTIPPTILLHPHRFGPSL
jgi:hypothetical protein